MMHEWQIEYKQTSEERYDSDMNDLVETQVKMFGVEILESYGGSGFGPGMVAENGYVFKADEETAKRLQAHVAAYIDRPVELTKVSE